MSINVCAHKFTHILISWAMHLCSYCFCVVYIVCLVAMNGGGKRQGHLNDDDVKARVRHCCVRLCVNLPERQEAMKDTHIDIHCDIYKDNKLDLHACMPYFV